MKQPRTVTVQLSTLATWIAIVILAGSMWLDYRAQREFQAEVFNAFRQIVASR